MQEIKFRVWDVFYKRFVEDCSNFAVRGDGSIIQFEAYTDDSGLIFEEENSKDFIIQQFTGFTGKNGKDIYDGDILKAKNDDWPWKEDCGWVCYYSSDAQFRIAWDLAGLSCEDNSGFAECYDIEVVGNIYEHTELLTNE